MTGDPWTARYGSYAYNAEYYNDEWDNKSRTLNIDANETITVKFTPDLVLKSVFSYDNTETLDYIYFSANHYNATTNDNGDKAAVVHNMMRCNKSITFDDELIVPAINIPTREKTIDRSFFRTILPIGLTELNANPAIAKQQNPGY